jgi:hypothetical protein
MMKKHLFILTAVLVFAWAAYACFNPADQWAAGVVWTSGETTDFSVIETMGEEGRHYLKESDSGTVKYTYRSHYAPVTAMVYLGSYATDFNPQAAPRMAVVLDTGEDKDAFDFAAAVRAELDWLVAAGVIEMPLADRVRAEDSLAAVDVGNAQYWTLQQDVLPYNSFFLWDSTTGTWSTVSANTYRGCGLDVAFALPPEAFPPIAVEAHVTTAGSHFQLTATPNPFKNSIRIAVSGRQTAGSNIGITIYDIEGKMIEQLSATSHPLSAGISWNPQDLPNGIYVVRARTGGGTLTKKVILQR